MLSNLIVMKTKLEFVNVLLGSLLGGRGGGGEARGGFAGKRVGHLRAFGGVRSLRGGGETGRETLEVELLAHKFRILQQSRQLIEREALLEHVGPDADGLRLLELHKRHRKLLQHLLSTLAACGSLRVLCEGVQHLAVHVTRKLARLAVEARRQHRQAQAVPPCEGLLHVHRRPRHLGDGQRGLTLLGLLGLLHLGHHLAQVGDEVLQVLACHLQIRVLRGHHRYRHARPHQRPRLVEQVGPDVLARVGGDGPHEQALYFREPLH
mmetsp:Transcript_36556/g.61593  ORF Transcript_36556/g.61593 Transcript_36556/m.61593 type:complete len:265 (+) Transcript_36556:973-1767(+)